jgi:hypothetical protein
MKATSSLLPVLALAPLLAHACSPTSATAYPLISTETARSSVSPSTPPPHASPTETASCSPVTLHIDDEPTWDLFWNEDGTLAYATGATEGPLIWWRFDPFSLALELGDPPDSELPPLIAEKVPEEDRYTHVVLSPSSHKVLYYIQRPPPTSSAPVMGEGPLVPVVNDLYIAQADGPILYVGQIVGGIDGAIWYPDDVTLLATTSELGPATRKTWQFTASVLPPIEPFNPPDGYPYSFSPDGRFLLYSDDKGLSLREVSTGLDTPLPFKAFPGETWWSSGSDTLAALASEDDFTSHIVTYDIPSAQVTDLAPRLTDLAQWYRPRVALSPDFALLAYSATDTFLGGGSRLSLVHLCPHGRPPTPTD